MNFVEQTNANIQIQDNNQNLANQQNQQQMYAQGYVPNSNHDPMKFMNIQKGANVYQNSIRNVNSFNRGNRAGPVQREQLPTMATMSSTSNQKMPAPGQQQLVELNPISNTMI